MYSLQIRQSRWIVSACRRTTGKDILPKIVPLYNSENQLVRDLHVDSYVILTVAGTFFVGFWHAYRVPPFRRVSGMKYPKAYADSGDMAAAATPEKKQAMYLFNCAQVSGNPRPQNTLLMQD